ncbi:DUF1206 domain-containing protein [Pontibacter populi]|uniref:DUF1206 domain-containing protein n=1 Tax=Pontibacter populi TaxID=890055 RepID=A0ABV1RYQ5_9BACT
MKDIAAYLPPVPERWLIMLAKVGLTAKGVLYCLLGALAFIAALELGKAASDIDRKSVFLFIENLWLGKALLLLEAIGLSSYCFWRLLQALKDTENKGNALKGLAYRARYAASSSFYGLLTLLAAKLALGSTDEEESLRQTILLLVLQKPLGHAALFALAGVVALAGAYQVYQGFSGRYRKKIKDAGWKHDGEKVLIWAGTVGYISRGTVWVVVGYLLLHTSLYTRAGTAEGSISVFRFLERLPYGPYLLLCVAIGLVCYGLFVFMEARFRGGKSHDD